MLLYGQAKNVYYAVRPLLRGYDGSFVYSHDLIDGENVNEKRILLIGIRVYVYILYNHTCTYKYTVLLLLSYKVSYGYFMQHYYA